MRQNRRVSRRRSVIGMHVMHLGAVLLACAMMVIFNLLADSSRNQLLKTIREKDALIQVRQAELDRAQARWEETKSTDNLENALARYGLRMTPPSPNQVIRIDQNGELLPKQRSVALVLQRLATVTTASLTPSQPTPEMIRPPRRSRN